MNKTKIEERKVYSHKFIIAEHERSKKLAEKFSVTLDEFLNDAMIDNNDKKENEGRINNMDQKILIVDDSVFARKVLIDILNKNGYTKIIKARDGMETLEKYEKEKPDLIILDLILPKIDGIKVLRR